MYPTPSRGKTRTAFDVFVLRAQINDAQSTVAGPKTLEYQLVSHTPTSSKCVTVDCFGARDILGYYTTTTRHAGRHVGRSPCAPKQKEKTKQKLSGTIRLPGSGTTPSTMKKCRSTIM